MRPWWFILCACISFALLHASPPHFILLVGDSTMVANCRTPGWLPSSAECRAVGGQSYTGYKDQVSRGCAAQIVVGSAGLNAGWGWKPVNTIQSEYADFISFVRTKCPESRIIMIGINQTRLISEPDRVRFNAFVSVFVDRYIEPPFGMESTIDGVHYSRKASWALWPLVFTGDGK